MRTKPHYTFGDSAAARLRLERLAALFAPHSRALLSTLEPHPGTILDIGCGPGFTTRLLTGIFPGATVVGIDASEPYVAAVKRGLTDPRVRFHRHDAACFPFPGPPPELIYVRFLLTHLAEPEGALAAWRGAAPDGCRLVVEELASLTSPDPLVARYYAVVAAMQRHYGQRFEIGSVMGQLADAAGWHVERFATRRLVLDERALLELHALNVRSWRRDPWVREHCDSGEIDAIEQRLDEVVRGCTPAPSVAYVLGQLVARA